MTVFDIVMVSFFGLIIIGSIVFSIVIHHIIPAITIFIVFGGLSALIITDDLTLVKEVEYYAVNLTQEQECQVLQLTDSHHLIRSVEMCMWTQSDGGLTYMYPKGSKITEVTFKVRSNDEDNLKRYLKELDFKLYDSEKDAKKAICQEIGGQWFNKGSKCMECK